MDKCRGQTEVFIHTMLCIAQYMLLYCVCQSVSVLKQQETRMTTKTLVFSEGQSLQNFEGDHQFHHSETTMTQKPCCRGIYQLSLE